MQYTLDMVAWFLLPGLLLFAGLGRLIHVVWALCFREPVRPPLAARVAPASAPAPVPARARRAEESDPALDLPSLAKICAQATAAE